MRFTYDPQLHFSRRPTHNRPGAGRLTYGSEHRLGRNDPIATPGRPYEHPCDRAPIATSPRPETSPAAPKPDWPWILDVFELGRARRQLQVTKSMSSAPWFLSDADEDGTR